MLKNDLLCLVACCCAIAACKKESICYPAIVAPANYTFLKKGDTIPVSVLLTGCNRKAGDSLVIWAYSKHGFNPYPENWRVLYISEADTYKTWLLYTDTSTVCDTISIYSSINAPRLNTYVPTPVQAYVCP